MGTLKYSALVVALICTGCLRPPPTSAERLTEAARTLNDATQFGRMDIAMEGTSPTSRSAFAQRHTQWGNNIRVVGVEFGGVDLEDGSEVADVIVNVSWTRMDEGELRSTQIRQHWRDESGSGWVLASEKRINGDLGLFGEPLPARPPEEARDVHFPTKTIK